METRSNKTLARIAALVALIGFGVAACGSSVGSTGVESPNCFGETPDPRPPTESVVPVR